MCFINNNFNYLNNLLKFKNKSKRGFTFVELLVVMAIMTALAAIIFTSFRNYALRQSLSSFSSQLRNDFIESRHKTVASFDGTSYGIWIGTTSLALFASSTYTPGDPTLEYRLYDTGVTATSSLSDGSGLVYFSRITGVPSATGTISIIENLTGASTTITIYGTGLID